MSRRSPLRLCAIIALAAAAPGGGGSAVAVAAELPPPNTGEIYIGEFTDDSIAVYGADGTYLRSFTGPGLDGTRGIVAMPDGTLYVASQFSNRVYVFDDDEEATDAFTHSSLFGPAGMMVHGDELYVCSYISDRIVVFDLEGNFRRWFAGGEMNGPNAIVADSAGMIYVTSVSPPAVIKFDADEQYVERFAPVGLTSPVGIARDVNDTLYVTSSAVNVIAKMDVDGNPLGALYHPGLTGPQGIAIDDRGHVLVSSYFRPLLFAFDSVGVFSDTLRVGSHTTPRSIAFRRMRIGDVDDDEDIDFVDLLSVLTAWGPCPDPPAACHEDVDRDGIVGFGDVLTILSNWDLGRGGTPGLPAGR